MFGFRLIRDRDVKRIEKNMRALDAALDHVGVHPAEEVKSRETEASFLRIIPATAENVLLRLVEERDAYRDMVDGPSTEHLQHELRVAKRNLAYAIQGRSADAAAFSAALREAGREKARLTIENAKLDRELNDAFQLLVDRGLVADVAEGVDFNMVDVLVAVLAEHLGDHVPTLAAPAVAEAELTDDIVRRAIGQAQKALTQSGGLFDAALAVNLVAAHLGVERWKVASLGWGYPLLNRLGYIYVIGTNCTWKGPLVD